MLLISSINEHLDQIRNTPTDLEVHASLANIYSLLSLLYKEVKKKVFSSRSSKQILEQKFLAAVNCTIEEFKILNDYAPNDPWVHSQLSSAYRSLCMYEEEKRENELILKLCPNDYNVLFRLGTLYFQLGQTAKGLQVYEDLKKAQYKRAEELLSSYGAIKTQEFFEDSI
jgi:hypothetical protein